MIWGSKFHAKWSLLTNILDLYTIPYHMNYDALRFQVNDVEEEYHSDTEPHCKHVWMIQKYLKIYWSMAEQMAISLMKYIQREILMLSIQRVMTFNSFTKSGTPYNHVHQRWRIYNIVSNDSPPRVHNTMHSILCILEKQCTALITIKPLI